ncbi:proline-rich protein 36 isoform X2 [Ochlerotatus camptorhynchus]|uniref:proline-rich protein 36 isoform X2 n=1 Tax=Ochlerotatus camptorhynchus TaxID=644619 RepID=UPI0031D3A18E
MMSASGEGAAPSPLPAATGSSGTGGGGGGAATKSDTSSRAAPVKNPLLSMQVTGLTLDDFAHNALLLPAAPPLPPPKEPTPSPPPMLEVSRESETTDIKKPIVFSQQQLGGAHPELQDPDSFSEIDLHSTADSVNNAPPSTVEYNPLQDLEESESREPNSYLQQTSALTAQFAAQLPNVASTVFSTFSRVIKGSSPGPQQPPPPSQSAPVDQLAFAPPVAAYDYSQQGFVQEPNCFAEQQQQPGPPPPPPTFFNPEAISQPGPTHYPPATAVGSNTYRLGGAKKKTYAHIPGLSTVGSPPTVVAPVQSQDLSQFAPLPEVISSIASQPASREQPQKPGFLFFEKLPNLLEKIPKPAFTSGSQQPPEIVSNPNNYFRGPPSVQSTLPEAPLLQPQSNPPEVPIVPFQTFDPQVSPAEQSTILPPPPTFFTPAQFPSIPNHPQHQPSKNPYSSSHLSRSVGLYKNPLSPTTPTTVPTFLPNQEPPTVTAPNPFFQPPPFEAQVPPPPVQYFNSQPIPTPVEPSLPITPATSSRSQSSLSESLNRKTSLFAPFEEDPQSEAKTILDSRSKSSENVLSPPPRPNSNLSEPALFSSDGQQPLSLFQPAAQYQNPTQPTFAYYQQQQQPLDIQAPLPSAPVSFFNPAQIPTAPVELPPPPTAATFGSKPYNLQNIKRPAYTVPPSIATSIAPPSQHPATVPVPPTQLFNPVAQSAPVAPFDLTVLPLEPPLQPQQQAPNTAAPVSFFNPTLDPTAPATFFSPIAAPPPSQDFNANPAVINPVPIQQQETIATQQPSSAVRQFFSSAATSPSNDLNANFANVQISPKPRETLANPSDFFNTELPSTHPSSTTGQTLSQVNLFNFFGQSPHQPAAAIEPPSAPATVGGFLFSLQDSIDKSSSLEDSPSKATESGDDQLIQVIEPDQNNAVNDSQLDDRYDDPSEQERIGNAPEPIFSSDNLFEFKRSAIEDDTYSKDVLIDANSSCMAGMTATAAATATGANSAIVDSSMASITEASNTNIAYRPVYRHWFFKREIESKVVWTPFTMSDSLALENALPLMQEDDSEAESDASSLIVHVDGGRHDVLVKERKMSPVYWKGASQEVRRCSWFYKNVDSRYVPYDEEVAELLEREYKEAATSGEWHRRIVIPNGETVVFHGPSVIVHFLQTQNPDSWGGSSPVPPTTNRPRVVKRGVDEFNIEDGEPERVDHLLFMVHGIGEACDLRFRPVEEVVDEFRSISAQLVQSHYRSSFDRGDIGRVEVLPISWHNDLHSEESGIDKKLKAITLESIPKLRNFTNDTVLDVLFYTSPMFCQNIIDAVGNSLNRLYSLFLERNPSFTGGVSLAGHSLGSLILFDLLCHQKGTPMETENSNPDRSPFLSAHPSPRPIAHKCCQQQINYEVGPAGTGQPYITYPQLMFNPKKFFALGSPIGMFVTVRGIDALGQDFKLPTCDGFFNIFHPYDPVAYRIEALVNPELSPLRPVLIPHHKGRKRMHLELKETMYRVGTDLKQKVMDTFRNTLDAVYSITSLHRPDRKAIECEVDKVLEDQLKFETASASSASASDLDTGETDLPLGQLNQSRRIDYVLQEAPLEFFNEYLFALTSHVCYWESEDTMLFLMKEIYSNMGVQSDSQIPQQTMTIERPRVSTPTPPAAASSQAHSSHFSLFPQQHGHSSTTGTGSCNR